MNSATMRHAARRHRAVDAAPVRQRGAVAIIVALSLVVLFGFAGLALDLGRLHVNKTELQSAADACALAASRELICASATCPAQFLINAETAGIFAAGKNLNDLQSSAVTIAPADVRFSTALGPNSGYLSRAGGASTDSKFAMCIARSSGLVPWFMDLVSQLLGQGNHGPSFVASMAVATLAPSQSFCLGPPMGVCKVAGSSAPDYGYTLGEWIASNFTANGNNVDLSGNFKWVDFTPTAGGNNEINDGLIGNGGVCDIKINDQVNVIQPGQQQGAKSAYNTRFGLYPNGANAYTPADAPPDRTGYAYPSKPVPPDPNHPPIAIGTSAYADYVKRQAANTLFKTNEYDVSGSAGNIPGTSCTATQLHDLGDNRRLIAVPVVDCNGTTASILGSVCVLMLNPMSNGATGTVYLEYRGNATAPGSPCAPFGVPGGGNSLGPMVPTLVQ
jgi:Flp pilus assembly protein TadG